ncbi:MAG TPA: hypothetical protein VNL14_20405 [Candidatus Acidoferrales bacterium]|nr:hypothetical protein [Candidatus Acidoferrales bacterium]
MPLTSKYIMIASMDVEPEREALFNEVYDQEHVPNLSRVPGVISIARFERQELTMSIGGEKRVIRVDNEPKYAAIYELESPEALVSPEWAEAVEKGRWPAQVRPHTRNRRHVLLKLIPPRG